MKLVKNIFAALAMLIVGTYADCQGGGQQGNATLKFVAIVGKVKVKKPCPQCGGCKNYPQWGEYKRCELPEREVEDVSGMPPMLRLLLADRRS